MYSHFHCYMNPHKYLANFCGHDHLGAIKQLFKYIADTPLKRKLISYIENSKLHIFNPSGRILLESASVFTHIRQIEIHGMTFKYGLRNLTIL